MQHTDFNSQSEQALYVYKRHPLAKKPDATLYMLLKKNEVSGYEPIGDYRVLDKNEDPDITEKKVINLVAALNGRGNLIQCGKNTKTRMLYHPVPRKNDTEKSKVIFYTLSENKGVSVENAILTIEEDLVQ